MSCFDTFAQTAQYTGTAEETIITLPLADNVDYTIEGKDRELYLSFSRPLADRLQDIAAKLPSLVAAANIANNQKSMLLTLKEPLSVQNFRNDGNLIIKLRKQDGELADRGIDSRLNRLLLNYGNHQDFLASALNLLPAVNLNISSRQALKRQQFHSKKTGPQNFQTGKLRQSGICSPAD